jgi:hypothetical protein
MALPHNLASESDGPTTGSPILHSLGTKQFRPTVTVLNIH